MRLPLSLFKQTEQMSVTREAGLGSKGHGRVLDIMSQNRSDWRAFHKKINLDRTQPAISQLEASLQYEKSGHWSDLMQRGWTRWRIPVKTYPWHSLFMLLPSTLS